MASANNTQHDEDARTERRISRFRKLTERPVRVPSEYFHNFVFINYVYITAGLTHLIYATIFQAINAPDMRTFALVGGLLNFVSVLFNYQGMLKTSISIFAAEIHVFILVCVFFFGGAGFHYFLFPLVVLLFLLSVQHTGFTSFWAILDSILFMSLNYYATSIQLNDGTISPQVIDLIRLMNTNATFLFLALTGYHYSKNAGRAENMLQRIATTDPLTNLSNRRDFADRFEMERARFSRNGRPFSLIMGDIDHFKNINDTYGHDCGDYVIRTVSDILRESLRQQDIVGRWGGEEFIVMLPETTLFAGDKTAEKLRRSIELHDFSYHGESLLITMSFGVAVFERDTNLEEVVHTADQCLYYAKEAGRNRVISHNSLHSTPPRYSS